MTKTQLMHSGLKENNIELDNICTKDNNDLVCPYRAENGKTGRMGVCVVIK